jgi:ribose 5-phosphate isomerase B
MKIAMASDHAGFELKEAVKEHLTKAGHDVSDYGATSNESADYPDYGMLAAKAVASGDAERGVLVCGSGQGMVMVANKVHGVRAALAWHPEIAKLSRQHNDANVLALPARFMGIEQALEVVDTWLATEFEGGRHDRRVKKMMDIEESEPWQI